MKQRSFASLSFESKKKPTRRERFLGEMEYALSDPAMEDALYEIESMRRFAGLELNEDAIPDETTILKFRRFLEQHDLAVKILEAVNAHLGQRGLLLRQGTIVDATIIQAPSSTKNRDKQRDPDMRQTKKGQQWYSGNRSCVASTPASLPSSA